MDTYTLHLAMAALVGASFVAVSAFYMHRKTLNQLLEFAKTMEREREIRLRDRGGGGDDDSDYDSPPYSKKRRGGGRRKGNGYRRASASLPDVAAAAAAISGSGGGIDEGKRNGTVLPVDGIPPGLPRLHTLTEVFCFSRRGISMCIRSLS